MISPGGPAQGRHNSRSPGSFPGLLFLPNKPPKGRVACFANFFRLPRSRWARIRCRLFPGGTPAVVTIQAPTTNKYSAFYGTSGAGKQIVELVPGATHVRELVNPCDLYAVGTSGDAIVAAAEAAV